MTFSQKSVSYVCNLLDIISKIDSTPKEIASLLTHKTLLDTAHYLAGIATKRGEAMTQEEVNRQIERTHEFDSLEAARAYFNKESIEKFKRDFEYARTPDGMIIVFYEY